MVTSALLLSILSFVLAAGQSDDTTFANPTIAIASHCSGSSLRSSSQSLPDSDYSSARNGNVSVEPETDDSCRSRFLRGADLAADPATARAGYDSLRSMLASCLMTTYACAPFSGMTAAISNMDDNQMWLTHRLYLEKIYPNDTQSCYRCGVIYSVAQTFRNYIPAEGKGIDYNGYVAILDYILASRICYPGTNDTTLWESRSAARRAQYENWRDTVKDSLKTPLDTSAVSLKDIGLGFLLSAPEQHGSALQAIRTFYVVDNPFDRDPVIRYSLEGSEVAQLEVFDILGNRLWASTREVVGKEEKEIVLPLSAAEKYLYVRLSSASGAVRTLRVVRK